MTATSQANKSSLVPLSVIHLSDQIRAKKERERERESLITSLWSWELPPSVLFISLRSTQAKLIQSFSPTDCGFSFRSRWPKSSAASTRRGMQLSWNFDRIQCILVQSIDLSYNKSGYKEHLSSTSSSDLSCPKNASAILSVLLLALCQQKELFRWEREKRLKKESIKNDEEDGLKEKWPAVLPLLSPKGRVAILSWQWKAFNWWRCQEERERERERIEWCKISRLARVNWGSG